MLAIQRQGAPHARILVLIEATEESGSPDLPYILEHLKNRLGVPNFIVCLDSGCGNYEQLFITSTLRGILMGDLHVATLTGGVHSGNGGGIVADTFRIATSLVARIEDRDTGKITIPELQPSISAATEKDVAAAAEVVGKEGMIDCFPFLPGGRPVVDPDSKNALLELALNRWYRPQLAVIGAAGLPGLSEAGNVLRPSTTLCLSIRLPPTVDTEVAASAIKDALTADVPHGAQASFTLRKSGAGWAAPQQAPWLQTACEKASATVFGKPPVMIGEGGSIPFMGMLGKMYPYAQFLVTGVLGPGSNAHGPNEKLHLAYVMKLTTGIAHVLVLAIKNDMFIHFKFHFK